jgi:regulator of protease activity HflC (stomatin/prohibitin superfamily)
MAQFGALGSRTASFRKRFWQSVELRLPNLWLGLLAAMLILALLLPRMIVTVPSGQVGVLWKRFGGGTVLNPRHLLEEGLHLILPWDRAFLYDLRLQASTQTYDAISQDGVSLTVRMNIRYKLKHDLVPQLHQAVGPEYADLLVKPEVGSRMREVIAQFTAQEVYSTARQQIQDRIRELSQTELSGKFLAGAMNKRVASPSDTSNIKTAIGGRSLFKLDAVDIVDTLILGLELPAAVVAAINRKTEQLYIAEEYRYRVERERRESERKRIEAMGIREFQQIVSQGISDSYLRWRGIEATLQLAQSTNAKVVIIGQGKNGLPIILGNADSQASAMPPQKDNSGSGEMPAAAALGGRFEDKTAAELSTPTERTQSAPPASEMGGPRYLFPSWPQLQRLIGGLLTWKWELLPSSPSSLARK